MKENTGDTLIRGIARELAEKIDGVVEEHRVLSRIGGTRAEALSRDGTDEEIDLASGDVQGAIVAFGLAR
jgi:hypothetical protein